MSAFLHVAGPLALLAAAAVLALAVEPFLARRRKHAVLGVCSVGAVLAAAVVAWRLMPAAGQPELVFSTLRQTHGTSLLALAVLACAAMALGALAARQEAVDHPAGEVYGLVLLSTCGMLAAIGAREWLTLLVGVETMSLPLYALVVSARKGLAPSRDAAAGAMRYAVLGALAGALAAFGAAQVYGATGSTMFGHPVVLPWFAPLALLGAGLLAAGFLVKAGAAPFHLWVPEAYGGAPAAATAFMAGGVKIAAFAALVATRDVAFAVPGEMANQIAWGLGGLGLIGVVVGTFAALGQRAGVQRLIAYSAVAHAGFMLLALAGHGNLSYYLVSYAVPATLGLAALSALAREDAGGTLEGLAGRGFTRPLAGAALALSAMSLAGIPPLPGFLAKWQVLAGLWHSGHQAFAGILLALSLLGAAFYLRIPLALYRPAAVAEESAPATGLAVLRDILLLAGLVLLAALALAPGFIPGG